MKKGFTLIELLIVIAIIGILASIVIVSFSEAKKKSGAGEPSKYEENKNDALYERCVTGAIDEKKYEAIKICEQLRK